MKTLPLAVAGLVTALSLTACTSEVKEEPIGASSSELSGCVPVNLTGVDVSWHNGDVDWKKVKASGRSFAFARISDGLTNLDPKFAGHWPAMKKAGLIRGAYQYFRARREGVAQADVVIRMIEGAGGLQPGDLPPVLDLETADNQATSVVLSRAKAWIDRIEDKLGIRPIIYTGNNMSSVVGNTFKDYLLWVPHYEVDCPRVPAAWKTWTMWQDSENGRVPGIGGDGVDTDFFNGDRADLESLTAKNPNNAEPPPAIDTSLVADADESDIPEGGARMGDSYRR